MLSVFTLAAPISSCVDATEIELHITTNACALPGLSRVDVYTTAPGQAFSSPVTSISGCTSDLGTLYVTPSGPIDGRIELAIVAAAGDACANAMTTDSKCIIARRELSFEPHHKLELPIFLDSACVGVQCPESSTCEVQNGAPTCVSSSCDADGGVACSVDAGGPDATIIDATIDKTPLVDVFADSPIIVDATPPPATCVPIDEAGTPSLLWSFNAQSDNLIHEDTGNVTATQPMSGTAFLTTTPLCGTYLQTKVSQPVAIGYAPLATASFTVGFAFRAVADGSLVALAPSGPYGGFTISIVNGAINVLFGGTNSTIVLMDNVNVVNNGWHRFAMSLDTPDGGGSPALTFLRDGQKVAVTKLAAYIASKGTLSVGPSDAIDELAFWLR